VMMSERVNGSSEIKSRHVLGLIARRFKDVMSNTFPYTSALSSVVGGESYGILEKDDMDMR